MSDDLDPRWEWLDVRSYIDAGPVWIKGHCRHLEVVPVTSVLGEDVSQLCKTCDRQFEPHTFDLSDKRFVAQLVNAGWTPEAAVAMINDKEVTE